MRPVLIAFAILATACTPPGVQYATTNPSTTPTPPRPAEAVQLYFTPPACPYVEIGYVETTPPVLRRDWTIEQKLRQMRDAAGQRGADAILVIGHNDTSGHGHEAKVTSHDFSAVALAFTGDACASPCGTAPGCS